MTFRSLFTEDALIRGAKPLPFGLFVETRQAKKDK